MARRTGDAAAAVVGVDVADAVRVGVVAAVAAAVVLAPVSTAAGATAAAPAAGASPQPPLASGGPPSPPASYYGTVTVAGEPAPAGVVVSAAVNGTVRASLTTDADGSFGGSGAFDEKLVVNGSAGDTVTFRVAGEPVRNVTWASGDHREVSLSVSDDAPPAAAVEAPDQVPAGTTVAFDASASSDDVAVAGYEWTLPDGSTASGPTATATLDAPGSQTVEVTVTDAAGNTDTATATVTVTGGGGGPPGDPGPPEDDDDDDDEGGPPDTPGAGSPPGNESAAPVAVVVTPDAVNVSVSSLPADESANVSLPAADPANGSGVAVEGLGVEAAATVNATLGVTVDDEPATAGEVPPPPGASGGDEAGGDEASGEPVAYVTVDENVAEDRLETVTFEFTVSATELADRGVGPSAVSLWRRHDGAWNAVETRVAGETGDGDGYRFVAESPGLSVFAVRAGPADVAVTGAAVEPASVAVGEPVTVSATVANDGASNGTATVPFVVDGERVAERSVAVPAGGERTVTATYAPESAGEFAVAAGNASAGTLSVTAQETATSTTTAPSTTAAGGPTTASPGGPPTDEPAGFSPLSVAALVAGLGALLALVLLVRRRRA